MYLLRYSPRLAGFKLLDWPMWSISCPFLLPLSLTSSPSYIELSGGPTLLTHNYLCRHPPPPPAPIIPISYPVIHISHCHPVPSSTSLTAIPFHHPHLQLLAPSIIHISHCHPLPSSTSLSAIIQMFQCHLLSQPFFPSCNQHRSLATSPTCISHLIPFHGVCFPTYILKHLFPHPSSSM
jgi:hypothetical protein